MKKNLLLCLVFLSIFFVTSEAENIFINKNGAVRIDSAESNWRMLLDEEKSAFKKAAFKAMLHPGTKVPVKIVETKDYNDDLFDYVSIYRSYKVIYNKEKNNFIIRDQKISKIENNYSLIALIVVLFLVIYEAYLIYSMIYD